MKKYTKRLLAFLLAAVMVVTGVPMSAKEAKAASDFSVDVRNFTGYESHTANVTYDATFAGPGWRMNPATTGTATWTYNKTYSKLYLNCGTNKKYYAFDFTAPAAGTYDLVLNHIKVGGSGMVHVWVNDVYAGTANLQLGGEVSLLGVPLVEGEFANTIKLYNYRDTSYGGTNNYFRLLSFDFLATETPTTLALDVTAGTTALEKGDATTIEATYGSPNESIVFDANQGKYSLAYASSDANVVAVDGANVTAVAPGNASVTVSLVDNGKVVATKAIDFTVVLGEPEYASSTLSLEDNARVNVGDSYELSVDAVLDNGEAITDGISVVYESTDTTVATVTDNVLNIVGTGNATINAIVSYQGEVKETLSARVRADEAGVFYLDFTEADMNTVGTDGDNRWYMSSALGTKSKDSLSTVPWSINFEKTHGDYDYAKGKTGGRFFLTDNGVPYMLRIMTGSKNLYIDFEAPAAGAYNMSLYLSEVIEKGGYTTFYVNGEYAGSADGHASQPQNQNLFTVDLVEGTNQLRLITVGLSTGTDDYISMGHFRFAPVNGDAREITSLAVNVDIDTYDMIAPETGWASIDYTTTDGTVLVVPDFLFSSSDADILEVKRTGEVNPKAAGTAEVIVTVRDMQASAPVTVNDSRPRYTVTWVDEDGTILEVDDNKLAGDTVSYKKGATPEKEADAQYTYTFDKWVPDVTVVEGDTIYTATWIKTLNSYTVSFVVNGETVSSETYEYGSLPVAPEVNDYEDSEYVYTFDGWDKEISTVTGETTYTAKFKKTAQNYTITFQDEDGSFLAEVTVAPGDVPKYTGETPVKAGNAQYSYTFVGWTPEVVPAAGNEIYTAVYTQTVNKYTVLWTDSEGNVIEEDLVEYGTVPTYDGATPTKAADLEFTYTFAGWDREVVAVTDTTSYAAQFESTPIEYTITFVVNDEVFTDVYYYGADPAVPEVEDYADADYTYAFKGWDKDVVAVAGDATYTAVFEKTAIPYEARVNGVGYMTFAEAFAAANDGDELTLCADVTMSSILSITKAITLDGNGYALTSTAGRAINVDGANGATIKNLTINASGERAINVINGATNVTIDNVTAIAANYAVNVAGTGANAVITINGSDLTGLNTVNIAGNGVNVTINDTKITCNDQTTTESYAAISVNANDVTVAVTGGEVVVKDNSIEANIFGDNSAVTFDGTIGATAAKEIVAKVGDNGFYTLQEAVDYAAAKGGVVTLNKDFAVTEKTVVNGKVTVDLNGKTLTLAVGDNNNYDVVVKGNLTIEGEGNVVVESTYGIGVTGTLTVNGGTFTDSADTYYVIGNWGTTTINAGNFDVSYMAVNGFGQKAVAVNGGTFKSADAYYVLAGTVAITAGTFDRNVSEYCAEGLATAPNADGTYGVVASVAEIDGYPYASLEAAVADAADGDVITLVADVTVTEKLTVAKEITLNLGGKTLTLAVGNDGNYDVIVKGNLTIEGEGNVVVESTYGIGVTGTLTVNGGNYTDSADTYYVIGNWGTTTINAGDFDVAYMAANGFGGKVAITGGTFKSADADYVIAAMPGCMEVTGGTFDRDVTEYCADGFGAAAKADGTYAIEETYTVQFVVEGTVVSEVDYVLGATVVVPEDPTKAADAEYTYAFAGWTPEVVAVAGDATYTAVFEATAIPYEARVNGVGYMTFAEAFAAANDGDELTLCADVTMSSILSITKAITLDGNGYALTSTAGRAINVDGANGATIKNLTINASGERAINVINGATNVTIDNVTATAANYAVNVAGSGANAVITINGSDLTGLNTVNIAGNGVNVTINDTKITCNDQTTTESYAAISVNANDVTVAVTGGEVVVKDNSIEANIFGDNSAVTFDGTIGATAAKEIVAKVGDNGFYTLQAAADYAAAKGGVVTLNKDFAVTEKTVVTGKVTVDLNGKTLTLAVGDDSNYDVVVKGDLTITGEGNVVVESTYGIGVTGTLTVNGGTFTDSADTYYVIGNWGTTTINAGDFDVAYMAANGFAGNVAITGGTFKSADDYYVVAGNVAITGGTYDRDVTEYCAEGLGAAPKADGSYEIEETYTVQFVVEGAVVSEAEYVLGAEVVMPEDPTKAADAQYTYTFAGWTPTVVPVAGDATYEATFETTVNEYTITWIVDGVTTTDSVAYGEVPVFAGSTDKAADAQYTYTFAGWTPEVVAVTGDATYTAVYETTINEYTITWIVDGVTTTDTVAYGETPVFAGSTDKAADAQYTYTFLGWDAEVVPVTGDATYTAVYETTVNAYTVTWMNFDGTVLATESYEYGQTPEYKGEAPTFGGATFTGWSPAVSAVEGDVVYTAQYSDYTGIYWTEEDGVKVGYYYVNGAVKKGAGLVELDGYLYWVLSTGKISTGTYRTIKESQTNGLVPAGTYYFFNNGIMATTEVKLHGEIRWTEENGKQVGYYYVQDEICKDVGLVEVYNPEAGENCWYYVLYSGKVKKNYVADGKRVTQTVKEGKLNNYPGSAGLYSFYEDGVMYDPLATETGKVVEENGAYYYYVDGHIRKDAGLVRVPATCEWAGEYVFVLFSGKLKVNSTQTVKEANCNGHTEFVGAQRFDARGCMIMK